ncbi:MAG: thiolase family protein [Mycobacterium sp.]|uniref:thiolase family protein n=1 Tax=Mycobacterium sp. TaxID=1785 RepID=UPI003F9D63FC
MTRRYPARDQVAIVGIGTTPFSRDSGRSELSLVVEACQNAIKDAGLTRDDIDGLSGDIFRNEIVQSALGIPEAGWSVSCLTAFNIQMTNAMMAVASGVCETVLVHHSMYRTPMLSASAAKDPFRKRAGTFISTRRPQSHWPDSIAGEASVYAPWARKYFDTYKARPEHLGYIAVNARSNAQMNDHAAVRDSLTIDDYLSAPMLWDPLRMLDMEFPVDGADAFVVTTAERARDLPHRPVLIHAAVAGQTDRTAEENLRDVDHSSQKVVSQRLWDVSELTIDDVDVYYPFDGFTITTLKWIEDIGYCGRGEAGQFLDDHWDGASGRIVINGRVPINTHGGNMSEGASQGSGHIREAVQQLRGDAGQRQVQGARVALATLGGFFFTPGGLILRAAE